ncbi:hypothetical protein [Streptomyces sp. NPDC056690]
MDRIFVECDGAVVVHAAADAGSPAAKRAVPHLETPPCPEG